MSNWHFTKLSIHLKTPLRCGNKPLGFVSRTLPFVPCHVPLMALVPVAVDLLNLPDLPESYFQVQSFLEEHIRFTPFFLLDPEKNEPLYNIEKDQNKIEELFLRSTYGVAIDYKVRGAIDQHLFETETIIPKINYKGKIFNTVLQGYMFWQEGKTDKLDLNAGGMLNNLKIYDIINKCQWGGDRNKGLGRIEIIELKSDEKIWGAEVQTDKEVPVIKWPECKPAPFYLKYPVQETEGQLSFADNISGKLIPITGRIFDKSRGPGQQVWKPEIVWNISWECKQALSLNMCLRSACAV